MPQIYLQNKHVFYVISVHHNALVSCIVHRPSPPARHRLVLFSQACLSSVDRSIAENQNSERGNIQIVFRLLINMLASGGPGGHWRNGVYDEGLNLQHHQKDVPVTSFPIVFVFILYILIEK